MPRTTREPLKPTMGAWAGVKNTVEADRLGLNDLVAGANVDLDDSGQASTRAGAVVNVSGAASSIWSPGDDGPCLFVQDGELKRLRADLVTADTLASGLSGDPMAYLPVNDRIYHSDGTMRGVLDGGRVRDWGIPIPPVPLGIPTYGHLAGGSYLFTMTRVAADGRESGADLAARVDVDDGGGIAFTWDAFDDGYVAIYVTEADGEALFRAAIVPATDSAYTWTGGALAKKLEFQFLDAPPAGRCLSDSNGCIYIADGPDIYRTDPLSYEHCDLTKHLRIDGTAVNLLVGLPGGVFVGTEQQVVFLAGGRLEEMAMRQVVDARGVFGSAVRADIAEVTGRGQAGQKVALFTTGIGVCMGLSDGSIVNLTKERYVFNPPTAAAAALRRGQHLAQYIVTS